jgi:hypothetical protein
MASNIDDGISASSQAAQAMQDAKAAADFYEDRVREGAGGVPIVEAGAANTPLALPDDPVVTGTHRGGA